MIPMEPGYRLVLPTEELLPTDEWQFCDWSSVLGVQWTGRWATHTTGYRLTPSLQNLSGSRRICRRKLSK